MKETLTFGLAFGDPKRRGGGPHWAKMDLYIDYAWESVMFRWDHKAKKVFRKFYGDGFEKEVSQSNKLWTDARCEGLEITQAQYEAGQPKET